METQDKIKRNRLRRFHKEELALQKHVVSKIISDENYILSREYLNDEFYLPNIN